MGSDAANREYSMKSHRNSEITGKVLGVCTNTSAKCGTYQSTWGTPPEIADLVYRLFGRIDLDLASDETANKVIKADHGYYSIRRMAQETLPGI